MLLKEEGLGWGLAPLWGPLGAENVGFTVMIAGPDTKRADVSPSLASTPWSLRPPPSPLP